MKYHLFLKLIKVPEQNDFIEQTLLSLDLESHSLDKIAKLIKVGLKQVKDVTEEETK